jgi:hypothetical protein
MVKNMDTTKSNQIVDRFNQNTLKMKRHSKKFSGTYSTTKERMFPILGPVRKADWKPDWDEKIELIFLNSDESGYRDIFRTNAEDVCVITNFVENDSIGFVQFTEDIITHTRISLVGNLNETVTVNWVIASTAITPQGNEIIDKLSENAGTFHSYQELLDNYLTNLETQNSEKLYKQFSKKDQPFLRKCQEFTGTWNATVEEFFPLLCPAREADWIPGWECELIYTDSGYAEDMCVFKTDKNSSMGEGIWAFVGYQKNEFIEFVRLQEDMVTHAKIVVKDNQDGTVSGTWKITQTALTKQGNLKLSRMGKTDGKPLIKMVDYYLTKGKTISKTLLGINVLHAKIRGH